MNLRGPEMIGEMEIPEGILLVDSVNYLNSAAQGNVAIASSHGGTYAAYKAAASGARAVIFNDAGVGREDAGIACLDYCEQISMAAAVVSHTSARIGEAADMLRRGIISHANRIAKTVNCTPGTACAHAAVCLKRCSASDRHTSSLRGNPFPDLRGPPTSCLY